MMVLSIVSALARFVKVAIATELPNTSCNQRSSDGGGSIFSSASIRCWS
jgi:hypothetical protein